MADESQVFGIGAEAAQAAKVAVAGGFGAAVLLYIRHPGTVVRATLLICIGVGIATIFSGPVSKWSGFGEIQIAALLGLLGKGVAAGLITAIEKTDFGQWLPGRKKQED